MHVIVHEWGFAFGCSALVALGTLTLAFGTVFLAFQARNEARAVERESQQKYLLPVKNAGLGAALNVQGALNFGPPSGVTAPIIRTNLAAGDKEDLRLHVEADATN
jgi:hypothetical protein